MNHDLRSVAGGPLAALAMFFASVTSTDAQVGVTADTIVFGQTAAFGGPAYQLGSGMRDGILAAFSEANRAGGVAGRRLELVALDDGYEPERAIVNADQLIEHREVFGLVGVVGTPTSLAIQPIATEAGVPFIGAFTGAAFLRDPSLENVVNVRASYAQEASAWVDYLVDELDFSRIAIFYQDDSFGRAGLDGVTAALDARGMSVVAEATYMRNTTAVKRALLTIRKAAPEAVVIVGAYEPAAEFIRVAREIGPDAVFMNISFVGSTALARELGEEGEGVLVTQVVPLPEDATIPVVASYQEAVRKLNSRAAFGFVSLEGYIVGRFVVEVLKEVGSDLTREAFLATVRDVGTFAVDDLTMSFADGDNQGLDRVFLTEIQADATFRAVDTGVQ